MWVAFANAKATHILFSKNINIYAIFNDQSFKDVNFDIVSFEQLGPAIFVWKNHLIWSYDLFSFLSTHQKETQLVGTGQKSSDEYPTTWLQDYKTFHAQQLSMKFSLLINVKMPTIVGIFIFISRKNFMLSYA